MGFNRPYQTFVKNMVDISDQHATLALASKEHDDVSQRSGQDERDHGQPGQVLQLLGQVEPGQAPQDPAHAVGHHRHQLGRAGHLAGQARPGQEAELAAQLVFG